MQKGHKWSIHNYLNHRGEGLYSKLELSNSQTSFLKSLRKQARNRIRDAFTEVQAVFRTIKRSSNPLTEATNESIQESLYQLLRVKKSLSHVDSNMLDTLAKLSSNLNEEQQQAFLEIRPKFRTQGSFQYKTLNVPYCKPPQEMDIDDGVYFPMQMFEDAPALAHSLMIALVDSALQSLAAENNGWEFDDSKPTCSRIKVRSENVHLDVPMYAIPEEKFVQIKESVFDSQAGMEAFAANREMWLSEETLLDPDSVLLARRDRDKWQKSDPQVVQNWFTDSVKEIGEHLRLACRFLKSWRDARWPSGGGPSSIALMKCAVDTLGQSQLDGKDLGVVMEAVATNLPIQLTEGVESPDPSDERPLFPDCSQHDDKQQLIVSAASELDQAFQSALRAASKGESSRLLRSIFGERGISSELIIASSAAPVYRQPAKKSEASVIEQTMTSG